MANEIQQSATLTIRSGDMTPAINSSNTLSLPSGSSYFGQFTQNINAGSWTGLITQSNSQVFILQVANIVLNNTGSLVNVATDAAGTKGFSTIPPNLSIQLCGSGSGTTPTNYYFNAATASAQLQVTLVQY